MGKNSLLLVIGLIVSFGIFSVSSNQWYRELGISQIEYYKYSYARNIARTAIHVTLREYDKGTSPVPTSGSFDGGSYSINAVENNDTLQISSVGHFEGVDYPINVKLARTTKPFPASKSAIGIRATPVTYSISGHPVVDGHNYDATGTSLIGHGDVPGVSTMNDVDSAQVRNAGGAYIQGAPPVTVDTTIDDPKKYIEEYKANADYVYNSTGTYAGATWGSSANPAIVYCNAGDNPAFNIKFTGNITGYGILVVRGDIQFSGTLDFYGLVVIDGFNTSVDLGASGTPKIVGGVIMAGNAGATVTLKGTAANAKVVYSSEALANARNIGKLRYYSILDWYE